MFLLKIKNIILAILFLTTSLFYGAYKLSKQDLSIKIKPPITEEQLDSLYKNGYLIIENVLDKNEISTLLEAVDTIITQENNKNSKDTKKVHGKNYYNIHNPFDYTDAFDYLIDHPKTFDVITYLMGPYIQAMACNLFVRYPCINSLETNIGKFHTDSGPSIQRILPVKGNLPLQLKMQFFLTDMQKENESNFIAVPGSHLKHVNYHHPYCLIPECNKYLEQGLMPPEAVQLKIKAGDVLIHMLNLWHAVAPNKSNKIRRSISIRYGQMWFKDQHLYASKDILLPRMTARQRRLIGDYGSVISGDIAYRAPDDQVLLMFGSAEKAAAYGWPINWTKVKK